MSTRWVWHLCNLPCIYALFRLISIARYAFKSPRICFWGTKYKNLPWTCCFILVFYIVTPGPAVIRAVFTSTVGRSLSRISYLLLVILAPHDSNVAVYAQVCWLFCVLYMPLFGLVQARPWFRSSMRISSVAGISKMLRTSVVATY